TIGTGPAVIVVPRQEGSTEGVEVSSVGFVSLSSRGPADDITKPVGVSRDGGPRPGTDHGRIWVPQKLAPTHLTDRIPVMLQFNLALLAGALTAAVAGCTQCDPCDDFPMPCSGGSCGAGPYPPEANGTYTIVAPGAGSAPMVAPPGVPLPPSTPAAP